MRKLLTLSIAFALGTTSARADDVEPYQPVNLPACEVVTLRDGTQACAYRDIEDWKAVLRVDAEVTTARRQLAARADELTALRDQVAAYQSALAVRETGLEMCQRSLGAERDALAERDRLYQNERAKPRWGTWASWGLAAVAGGVAIGLAVR